MPTVSYNGSLMLMQESAMKELGWRHGQDITGEQVFEGIEANARAFCREMDARRAQGLAAPDTSRLAKLARHSGTH